MTEWTAGYVADINYTYGYYSELNPLHAKLAFIDSGLAVPVLGSHCELGFGQGLSVNIHSAASCGRWFATDFNPTQAAFAQDLARASGADAHLFDESFADFCSRSDLPDFDSIGLHGIWSWISDSNRAAIVDFIRRKLKVGGVLYISYNTQPGWAAMVPIRDLLTEHAEKMAAPGLGTVSRIDGALAFSERLAATDPAYFKAYPQVTARLNKIRGQNRNYLAHEYFNRDWLPMSFSRMAEWLAPTKLSFACSACLNDHVDILNLSAAQQQLLREIPDAMFRQTVRDYMVNRQFRRDYWVKGPRRLTGLEQDEALRNLSVALTLPRADVSLKINGTQGEVSLSPAVYEPILDLLADNLPHELAEIERAVKPNHIGIAQLLQATVILTGAGYLALAQDEALVSAARNTTAALNAELKLRARSSDDIAFLASPVTGGGIAVSRFQQLFILAIEQGVSQPNDWAAYAWSLLRDQGQRIVKEGKALDSEEKNLAELQSQAVTFARKQQSVLQALQIMS